MINEDITKSSIFDLDLDKLLTKFANFETLNGISKLMCTMIFTNYLVFGVYMGLY